jgi:hypothetical protein
MRIYGKEQKSPRCFSVARLFAGHVCLETRELWSALSALNNTVRAMISEGWIAIAWRPRRGSSPLEWRTIRTAPIRLKEAQQMTERALPLMAHRHFGDRVELIVRLKE